MGCPLIFFFRICINLNRRWAFGVLDSTQLQLSVSSDFRRPGGSLDRGYLVPGGCPSLIPEQCFVTVWITQVIQNFEIDFDNYQSGVTKTINIDNYLTIGTNNISITLTGISTQATTTINFIYTVVDLQLSSSFDNKKGIEFTI